MKKKREKKYHKDKGGRERAEEGKTCLRCNITITNEAAGLLIHARGEEKKCSVADRQTNEQMFDWKDKKKSLIFEKPPNDICSSVYLIKQLLVMMLLFIIEEKVTNRGLIIARWMT